MTWAEAAPVVVSAISTLIVWGFSRRQTKDLKTTTQTESAQVQLHVDKKTEDVAKKSSLSDEEIKEIVKAMIIDLRIAICERMDAQDMKLGHLSRNAFAISKKVGSEWTEEVTTIKGDRK